MTKTIQLRTVASLHKSEKYISEKGLILKTSTITVACILLASIAISIFTVHSIIAANIKLAVNIGENKLGDDVGSNFDIAALEKAINGNIVKYITGMTAITFIILLAFVLLFGLGHKYKLFRP
jgi:flagellar biosynthesis protein FlhB